MVDLKTVHQMIGAASRVSFGKPEALMELLGVTPGAVTVFGADQRHAAAQVQSGDRQRADAARADQCPSAGQDGDDARSRRDDLVRFRRGDRP